MLSTPQLKYFIINMLPKIKITDAKTEQYICNLTKPTPLINILKTLEKFKVIKYIKNINETLKGILILSSNHNL